MLTSILTIIEILNNFLSFSFFVASPNKPKINGNTGIKHAAIKL